MTDDVDHPRGWVKPQRPLSNDELVVLIEARRTELKALEDELEGRLLTARLETVAKIRNIMRAHELSIDDLQASLTDGTEPSEAGAKRVRKASLQVRD
jgi:DNA-binding protein H-NS